ncbi:EAL domain-containing protein [Neptuniibacter sp.]|uniref:EAL domain-containing protein n=1 Tax=Neptuniibacter sp. TaxID=1962643 RepID=UPI00262AFA26|nr:EAL domain-containing protein [Neptuniibacter sp.]MCP4596597.1 EAL domain-containing protein [Neptuniibacter sp.]
MVNRLQGTIEYLLDKEDLQGVQREIFLNASPDHVLKLIVIDESGYVLFSADPEEKGNKADEMAELHLGSETLERVLQRKEIINFYNSGEQALYTLAPVAIPSSNNRTLRIHKTGIVLLELSAAGAHAASWEELRFLIGTLVVAVIILALALMWSLNRVVTKRANHLVNLTKSFSKGDYQAYAEWQGKDELGELGQAFNQMAQKIRIIHSQLVANADLLDELLENSPSMIVIRSCDGKYVRANPAYLKFVGVEKQNELLGRRPEEFLNQTLARSAIEEDGKVLEDGEHLRTEISVELDGVERSFISERFPLYDEEGEIYAVCTIAVDMTEQFEREKEHRVARYIFDSTNDGIIVTDANSRIVDVNPSFEKVTGYGRDEVIGRTANLLNSHQHQPSFYEQMWGKLDQFGVWSGEIWNRKKNGEIYPEWLTIKSITDERENVAGYFGVYSDISEHKKTEDSLRNLAYYDPLTNLANRALCRDRLSHDMDLAVRHGESLALVFIDLDFFKHVNDSLGHEYGDQLLKEAAQRIQNNVRASDTVVRWGGDEFILILPGIFQGSMAQIIANNVLQSLKEPFRLKNTDNYIGASIGIAVYPNDAKDAETLIQHADAAMYSAKNKGRDQICFFDPELNQKNLEQIQIKADMRMALEQNEFEMYYQPKICLQTNQIIGLEALLRWHRTDGKQISPAEFIPIAENSGLIVPLGTWVFQVVCEQVEQWVDEKVLQPGQKVSINLSPRQFSHPELLPKIAEQFQKHEGLQSYIGIEITETAVIENIQNTLPILEKIREMGLQVELDDFGSGYSSLSYLRRLPVDVLKVDRAFTAELDQHGSEIAIMHSIINMAHSLGMKVVAEGVETEEQLKILRSLNCDRVQGFFFAKPVPAEEQRRGLIEGLDRL